MSKKSEKAARDLIDEVVSQAEEADVRLIRCLYTDNGGIIRGKATNVTMLRDRIEGGLVRQLGRAERVGVELVEGRLHRAHAVHRRDPRGEGAQLAQVVRLERRAVRVHHHLHRGGAARISSIQEP